MAEPSIHDVVNASARAGQAAGWTGLRLLVVALCFMLNMLDGADMVIMSFIAPALAGQWRISPERLGVLFSASLAGMAIGCLFFAPLADRVGRRSVIVAALVTVSVAMVLSGFATDVNRLMLARLVVGIGVGTIGVSMTAMAAEFAPPVHASFAVGFVQAGWPLAAVMAGIAVAALLPAYGWQAMLLAIGVLSAVMLVLVAALLPESVEFLVKRQPPGALLAVNRVHMRLHSSPLRELPPISPNARGRFQLAVLFAEGRLWPSLLLWTAVTLGYFVLYFVISWIPKLAAQAGLPQAQAIYAGSAYNFGSIIGTTAVGWLSIRYRMSRVIAIFYAAAVLAMLVFGGLSMPIGLTLLAAICVGASVNGGFNGFWGMSAALYPAEIRALGVGWALGLGRIGAVMGPIVGGWLVGRQFSVFAIFGVFTAPLVLVAILTLFIPVHRPSEIDPAGATDFFA